MVMMNRHAEIGSDFSTFAWKKNGQHDVSLGSGCGCLRVSG